MVLVLQQAEGADAPPQPAHKPELTGATQPPSLNEKVLIRSVHSAHKTAEVPRQQDHRNSESLERQPRDRPRRIGSFSRTRMKEPHRPDQDSRDTSENQMQKQDALELLPFELKLPSQNAGSNNGQSADGGTQKIVVRHDREAGALGILREKVKHYTSDEQRNREMNQRHVLRVFRE